MLPTKISINTLLNPKETCKSSRFFLVPLESRMDSLLTTRQPTSSTPDEVKREEDTGQSNSLDKKNSLPGKSAKDTLKWSLEDLT